MAEAAAQLSALAQNRAVPPGQDATNRTLPMPVAGHTSAPTTSASAPSAATSPPASARQAAGTPSASAQWTPISAPASARRPTAATAAGRRLRPGLVAAIVLIVLAGTVAVALLLPNLVRPTTGSGATSAGTNTDRANSAPAGPDSTKAASTAPPTPSGPSANPSSEIPAQKPTTAELAQAVTDYYGLLPHNTDAAWKLLTASYQRQTGGRDRYEDFWNDMDTVTVTSVRATAPDRVQATLTYVEKSGNRKSTERRSFRVVRSGDVLEIDQSSVI